jgi:hypothetical protein
VKYYQTARLKEKAAPESINEEVGFLLRMPEGQGDAIRVRLKRQKRLKLTVGRKIAQAFGGPSLGTFVCCKIAANCEHSCARGPSMEGLMTRNANRNRFSALLYWGGAIDPSIERSHILDSSDIRGQPPTNDSYHVRRELSHNLQLLAIPYRDTER